MNPMTCFPIPVPALPVCVVTLLSLHILPLDDTCATRVLDPHTRNLHNTRSRSTLRSWEFSCHVPSMSLSWFIKGKSWVLLGSLPQTSGQILGGICNQNRFQHIVPNPSLHRMSLWLYTDRTSDKWSQETHRKLFKSVIIVFNSHFEWEVADQASLSGCGNALQEKESYLPNRSMHRILAQ